MILEIKINFHNRDTCVILLSLYSHRYFALVQRNYLGFEKIKSDGHFT